MERIKRRWAGPRIVFNYLDCSECKSRIEAPYCADLQKELFESWKIEEDVVNKAKERAKFEGLDKEPRLNIPGDPYYQNL
jgi:hypothetical protein